MIKAYPSYKSSGIIWIKEIPSHWDCGQLKYKLARNDGGVWGDETPDDSEEGTIVLRSTEITINGQWNFQNPARRNLNVTEIEKSSLKTGDLLITKSSGSEAHIGKTALVTPEIEQLEACYSNFMQRIHPQQDMESHFLFFFMNSALAREQFNYFSTTTTGLANLNSAIIGGLLVPFPSFSEQESIADYLDRKTAQIDTLIAKKWRQIELLQEQRTALINQAVTKGLDPSVPMKDSGFDWLGKIPDHWNLKRIKYIALRRVEQVDNNDDYGLLVSLDSIESKTGRLIGIGTFEGQGNKFAKGDVLFCKLRPYLCKVIIAPQGGIAVSDLLVLTPSEEVESRYLFYRLIESNFISVVDSSTYGAKMPRASWDFISNLKCPLPPVAEQQAIADFLDKQMSQIDIMVEKSYQQIRILQEYRTALISEAVTGKIDVRGGA